MNCQILSSFIHLVVCLTTGPKPLPKRACHIVRSRASSFKWEYPLLSLKSSNSFLRLLPCLPVTSIPPCIFPSTTRCRRQFLRKIWLIQFAFRLRISCRIFLCSLTLSNNNYNNYWKIKHSTNRIRTWYISSKRFLVNFPGIKIIAIIEIEIKSIIHSPKPKKKSSGYDGIASKVLNVCSTPISHPFTQHL